MAWQQDGTDFLVQREARWEAAVYQALAQQNDVKPMQEDGLAEHIQALQKEKFQEKFASLGVVVAVTGRKRLK